MNSHLIMEITKQSTKFKDLMRQVLSLVDMFRQAQCRFYIMDMFALEGQMRRVIGDLETIEKSENLFIPKDSCQFITLHSNANIRKKYFTYLKKTNMLNPVFVAKPTKKQGFDSPWQVLFSLTEVYFLGF